MTFNKKHLLPGLLTAVPALLITASGIMKFIGGPEIRQAMSETGVADYIKVLGLMELVFTALFVYPRTMKLGLLLLTSYFAGAIATDLSHGRSLAAPVMILTLVWIAVFVRDRSAFLPVARPLA